MGRVAGGLLIRIIPGLAVLCVALLGCQPLSAQGALPIPGSGMYLGIWANPALASNQEGAIELLEGSGPNGINHPITLHLHYDSWTKISQELDQRGIFQPDAELMGDIGHNRVPVISWGCDGNTANSDHVIAGGDPNEDAVIVATAQALAQYPGPVMLRWFWEFNVLANNQSCRGDSGGTPTQQTYGDFIAAWQHIRTLFQNAGASNVAFLWNPGHYNSDGNADDPHGFYPGNAYVDWIGVDTYQRSTTSTFDDDFGLFYSDFTQSQFGNRPLMVGENGSQMFSQNNLELQSTYLQGMLASVRANHYPLLKAYDYFDSGTSAEWVFDSAGLAAFATVASSSTFAPASILPHVADGNGFDTVVVLINTGATAAAYSLQFFDQSGAQVVYPLDPSQSGMSGMIQPGSEALIRTTGSGSLTRIGWGQLVAPPAVRGMVIYQQQSSAISLQEGSAPIASPSMHFFVPFDNTPGSATSIGFANPSPTQIATVNFAVRYETGGTDIVPSFNMNPLQQMANQVATMWPNAAGKRGMIEVTSNAVVGLVAFRFQGAALTLLDTVAPTGGSSTPITSTIAHCADGDNFRSTFVLTNSGTVTAPYTLTIFNATGQTQAFNFDVASPLNGTVPAGSTLTIDTTGLGAVTNPGWAQLSAPPAVSGIEVFRQTNPGKSEQQATIPISQINLAHFFLPFDNVADTTSIALVNPSLTVTATITVTFRYPDGTSNTAQLSLLPRNYRANQLANFFTATSGKAGVAEFISNTAIAVVEVRFNPTQAFTALRSSIP